jgi:hypothetical protein
MAIPSSLDRQRGSIGLVATLRSLSSISSISLRLIMNARSQGCRQKPFWHSGFVVGSDGDRISLFLKML